MRAWTAVVAVASTVVLGGAGIATAATSSADSQAATTAACQPGTLKASLVGGQQHDMNSVGTVMKVTNVGKATCSFKGYAGLALEGKGHKAIRTKVRHGSTHFTTNPGAHRITLKHGHSAYAGLAWSTIGEHSVKAHYLQISPTGSNSHTTVRFSHTLDKGALTETAWSKTRPATR